MEEAEAWPILIVLVVWYSTSMSEIVLDPETAARNKHRLHINPRTMLLVLALLVLVGIGWGVQYVLLHRTTKPKNTVADTSQNSSYAQSLNDWRQKLAAAKTPQEKSAAHQGLANVESAQGNNTAALADAQAAVSSDGTSYAAYAVLAMVKMQAGDNAGAIAAYKKAAELARATGTPEGIRGASDYEIMAASVGR